MENMKIKYLVGSEVKSYKYDIKLTEAIKIDKELLSTQGFGIASMMDNTGLIMQIGFDLLKLSHNMKFNETLTDDMINSMSDLNDGKSALELIGELIAIALGANASKAVDKTIANNSTLIDKAVESSSNEGFLTQVL